jgi:hypothetical protein
MNVVSVDTRGGGILNSLCGAGMFVEDSELVSDNPHSLPPVLLPRARICRPFKEPRIDSQHGGYGNPICCTGQPGYRGWRNRSIGIDS